MSAFGVLIALGLAYLWLTGWWFAGIVVFVGLRMLASYPPSADTELSYYSLLTSVAFGPWLLRQLWKGHLARQQARRDASLLDALTGPGAPDFRIYPAGRTDQ